MCIVDYDTPSVYSTTEQAARKLHKCSECGREIAPGERYRRTFGVWEGYANTFKTCSHCCVGQDWLLENCNGFMHAQLIEEVSEHAAEYRDIRFGMLRLKIGIRRKWRWFDGVGLIAIQPAPQPISEHTLSRQV